MNALQEAETAIDMFYKKNVSCATCGFFTPELIGGKCDGPEISYGYMADNTNTCTQHTFKNNDLEKELSELEDKHYKAWYIVEGFLFLQPPGAEE
jgi:hypothetical protein